MGLASPAACPLSSCKDPSAVRLDLCSKFRSATSELDLQSLYDAAVHLADTAFTQIKCGADFLHRQFFVVIKDDNQPLIAIEALRDQSHKIIFLYPPGGIFTFLIFQNVDFTNVLVTICFVPFFVQAYQIDGIGIEYHFF